jgi:hypothetical protein
MMASVEMFYFLLLYFVKDYVGGDPLTPLYRHP